MAEPIPLPDVFTVLRERLGDLKAGTPEAHSAIEQIAGELGLPEDQLEKALSPELEVALRHLAFYGPYVAIGGAISASFLAGVMWAEARRG